MKPLFSFILFSMLLTGFIFAYEDEDSGMTKLTDVLCKVEAQLITLLGPIAFLLVVMAAVVYGGSQLGDAQLRAKGQGWAVMAIVGAVIAFVIMMFGPWLVETMFGGKCEGGEWVVTE
ncbi:hypothetical protein J7J90_01335 [Candidatus Micrarchaeota archaeon]|nr:hypothetical protein [Candidatus Micrarchaeota archaeon]